MNAYLKVDSRPGTDLTLFCFPFAGGGTSVFREWAGWIPHILLCPVQLPGRETRIRERLLRRMGELADATTDQLLPHLSGQFAFFGHSMGAILAFEVAKRLRERRNPGPTLLIASASRGPQLPPKSGKKHDLPDGEFIDELRRLQGTPPDALNNSELMHLLLPVVRADFEICETYVHESGEPLDCPIAAIAGAEDQYVEREDQRAWRAQTKCRFSLSVLPGDHFSMLMPPAVTHAIARELQMAECTRMP